MPHLISASDDRVFALSNRFFSYVFRVTPEGILENLHYGAPLNTSLEAKTKNPRSARGCVTNFQGIANLSLSDIAQEYPTFGHSDYRHPAFHAQGADGSRLTTALYKSYKVIDGKPDLSPLPMARAGQCESLIITLEDDLQEIEIDLIYTVYADFGVLAKSVLIRNVGSSPIALKHIGSSCLDLPARELDMLHLHGSWAREFSQERAKLPTGRFVIDSNRGTSSAAHNPFFALLAPETSEANGEVYATTLVYSGDFAISVERGEFGAVRVLAGINSFDFNWHLGAGESFQTPEALHVYTPDGLRGMSHIWHAFIRARILSERFGNVSRPTYLNSWEAAYFDVTEERVLDLADKAKSVGVEMFVLDDGWFEGRNDDTTSLGDWTADSIRFPSGIPALARKVIQKGLKFGLWFEPEMVSLDSGLYRNHPDWTLQLSGREHSLGRNQLTLDLGRTEVQNYIFTALDNILSCGDVSYVKWDMNRNMTEVGSGVLAPEQQAETSHRYMLGLYALLAKLTQRYPDVLFENCASGGNRFDLGMLNFMSQGWVSDMCDPIARLEILNGASLLYPLDCMAAYIGPSPNHQNGRISSVTSRFHAGLFCAANGISLNEIYIEENLTCLQEFMALSKATRRDMLGGQFYRLKTTANEVCWQMTSADGETVYVLYFHILSAPNLPFRYVRLEGLKPNAQYEDQQSVKFSGNALMNSGLVLPYVHTDQSAVGLKYMEVGDFVSYLYTFKKV